MIRPASTRDLQPPTIGFHFVLLAGTRAEATAFERQTSRRLNTELRAELTKLGMQINDVPEAERARMREKLAPVIAKHQAAVGEDTAKAFFAAVAAAPR